MVLEPLDGVWMWRRTALLLVWRSKDKRLLWPWIFSEAEAGFQQRHMVQSDKAICCSASTAVGGKRKMKGWFVGGWVYREFLPLGCGGSRYSGRSLPAPWIETYFFSVTFFSFNFLSRLSGATEVGSLMSGDHDFVILQSDEQWRSGLWSPCKLWIQFLQHLFAPKAESCGSVTLVGADLRGGFSLTHLLFWCVDGERRKNCTLALPQWAEEPNGWLFLWGTL